MCVLTMSKISDNNGTEVIGLVTPTPDVSGVLNIGKIKRMPHVVSHLLQ